MLIAAVPARCIILQLNNMSEVSFLGNSKLKPANYPINTS
jgi:hypothetical protein